MDADYIRGSPGCHYDQNGPDGLSNATVVLFVVVVFGYLLTLGFDKKFGRTLYDYWSSTAVVRESESDRFYPTVASS